MKTKRGMKLTSQRKIDKNNISWIYKAKIRREVRLIANSYKQEKRIDYNKVFAVITI